MLASSPAVVAQTYKWVDEKGITHLSNEPPFGGKETADKPQKKKIDESKESQRGLDEETALKGAEAAFNSKDYAKAFSLLKPLAERGNPRAQNGLGLIYASGLVAAKDLNEAFKWHQKAAEQGYGLAQYYLGLMYADGAGVPKDAAEGTKWLRKAAEQGLRCPIYPGSDVCKGRRGGEGQSPSGGVVPQSSRSRTRFCSTQSGSDLC
jgi:Sel1 repeat/Domain of unknown function (DUF4124)